MKTALYGRVVFGASVVLFGVIALMWHDADTWQAVYGILSLPLGAIIGACLMIAQIAGGIGLPFLRTARVASTVLVVVYAVSALVSTSGIVASPKAFGAYDGFFEQLCMLCGALAVYATAQASSARSAALGRAARIGLGLCTIVFTLAQIIYLKFTASLVPTWIPPGQMFWAVLTTIAFAAAAIAILTNLKARLAMRLMTLMLFLFGVLVWVPALVAHPEVHGNWSEFAINYLITGAAWMVAELPSF